MFCLTHGRARNSVGTSTAVELWQRGDGWLRRSGAGRHKPEDVQATLAELTACSIGEAIARSCPGAEEVYLCGGGVRNADLVKRIARALAGISVASTERLGIHPD